MYREQTNNEVIIESSQLMNEKLSDSHKTNDNYRSSNDIANWPEELTHNMRVEIIKLGPKRFQNIEGPFKPAIRIINEGDEEKECLRFLSKKWFYKTLKNGDEVLRSWLLYSNSHSGLYCFCCKLFQSRNDNSPFVFKPFVNYWHLNPCIYNHENSKVHKQCFDQWNELALRLQLHQTIDEEILNLVNEEKNRWKEILKSVVAVIKFLSKQNLPFRGHREDSDSRNQGNFRETLKLLANYSTVISEHFANIELGRKGMTTYLSPTIQNELIELLGKKVKDHILEEIKTAKYFSILLDSTPDISHIEQMTFIVRYVKIDRNNEIQIKESFLNFFPLHAKNADEITKSILNELQKNGLDIMMCRGQAYDNASTMAGVRTGVQRRIKDINAKALFIPCGNHSLNLAGVHAVGSSEVSETFFAVVERIYSFFSSSTHRWEVLRKYVPNTVKRVIDTRWSAHYEAVKALQKSFIDVVGALNELCDQNENIDTRGQSRGILDAIQRFSFVSFLEFWFEVLKESQDTQKYLQRQSLSLEECTQKMNAFIAFLVNERDAMVTQCIERAIKFCEEQEIPVEERRIRRKKRMPGEQAEDVGLSAREEIKRCMLEVVDRFRSEAETRFSKMCLLNEIFGFLNPHNLLRSGGIDTGICRRQFENLYADDVDITELKLEIARFNRLVQSSGFSFKNDATALDVLQWLSKHRLCESTPYLCMSLKLYLTAAVSIPSCERSFSKLKLIKSYLRSTMGESRLSALAILSIESELVETISFDDVISEFASMKA